MTYINLTRAEIELLADCRSITLRDATGEHVMDEGSSAWDGLMGAACDSTDLLLIIREQKAEIERLREEIEAGGENARKLIESLAEIDLLRRGIQELDVMHRLWRAYTSLDPDNGRWYVFVDGECNNGRRADTLIELVRKLGASADDIGQTPDDA